MIGKTILLVEDDAEAVEMYQMFFEGAGFEVIGVCDSGEEAIELICDKRPKTVLLDIGLRGKVDGLGVLKGVKDFLDECRVVVVSAYPEHEEAAISLGAYAFVKKPILADVMINTFENALK